MGIPRAGGAAPTAEKPRRKSLGPSGAGARRAGVGGGRAATLTAGREEEEGGRRPGGAWSSCSISVLVGSSQRKERGRGTVDGQMGKRIQIARCILRASLYSKKRASLYPRNLET